MSKCSVASERYYIYELTPEGDYSHQLKKTIEESDCICEIPPDLKREYDSIKSLLVQMNIEIRNRWQKNEDYIRTKESRQDLYKYHLDYLINEEEDE